LFIAIEYFRYVFAINVPQPARVEVFDPSAYILTHWSYVLCKCDQKRGATNADVV